MAIHHADIELYLIEIDDAMKTAKAVFNNPIADAAIKTMANDLYTQAIQLRHEVIIAVTGNINSQFETDGFALLRIAANKIRYINTD